MKLIKKQINFENYVVCYVTRTRHVIMLLYTAPFDFKRDLQEVGGDCGNWMKRAQDRDRWRALVSTVMNFRVP
jgi:hypothetical protein